MTVTQAESAATGGLNVSCVCMPITGWGRLPNGAEMVQYDAPMFFSFTEHSLLSQYPNMRAECHWHIDFEFTYIMRGHMWYFVNGETIRLDEGQGIFVPREWARPMRYTNDS
ncbi:cupin domain-containing protein [Bifidobacterium sp.]|uniref:cupin domain-containing protein n=1 Tax=Bifidobacterium sp. TaxID=41200 RepID=UPI002903847F|nr:AraC family ligand binding domain-containing protein [Bifidobacterium sp.]MDU2100201.1 AraC family ligand binding domain-containing protein [Bifidobacterium sp.]